MVNHNNDDESSTSDSELKKDLRNKQVRSSILSAEKHVKDRLKMQKSSIFALIIVMIILFSLLIGFLWSLRYLLVIVGILVSILVLLRIYIHFYEIDRNKDYK